MQPHRQLVLRALAPQGQEPTENGGSPKAPTFLPWGSKTQAQSGKGHGGAKARHLGLHHGLCSPQTPAPGPPHRKEEFSALQVDRALGRGWFRRAWPPPVVQDGAAWAWEEWPRSG